MRIQTDNFGFNEAFRCRLHENSYNYPAHLHQFTEFAIILDGELEITVNDNKRVAKQGDIAVISPFAVHSFSTPKYCKIWIAVFSDTYILDFNKYAPDYDQEYHDNFFHGHMTPTGYLLTAKMVMSYIDYIIRNNPDDFKEVGFIGTPYKYSR